MLGSMDKAGAAVEGEEALVVKARAGDREAFDRLVERHLPVIWRVAWRILRHHEDTEDVVQETFLAAHRGLAGFRGEARFGTWLHRIAVTRALNHRRAAAEKVRRASLSLVSGDGAGAGGPDGGAAPAAALADDSPAASPLRLLEARELKQRLAECLDRLPAAWRAVLALRDGEGLSYQEMAAALETALGTVRSRLARARMALRRCVEGQPI